MENDCQTKNTGDYCFTNTGKYAISVNAYQVIDHTISGYTTITLSAGQTQCMYEKNIGIWLYEFVGMMGVYAKGEIRLEKCKSKTFVIK